MAETPSTTESTEASALASTKGAITPQIIFAAVKLYEDGVSPARLGRLLGKSKEWVRQQIISLTQMRPRGRPAAMKARSLNELPDDLRKAYVTINGYAYLNTDLGLSEVSRLTNLQALVLRDSLRSYGYTPRDRDARRSQTASQQVNRAIREGRLARKPCESCGALPYDPATGKAIVIGHHDDYNRPLDVRWLCPSCHAQWHKVNSAVMENLPQNVSKQKQKSAKEG